MTASSGSASCVTGAADLADRLARPEQDEVSVLEQRSLLRGLLRRLGHPVWLPK